MVAPTALLAYTSAATVVMQGRNHRPGLAASIYLLVVVCVAGLDWAVCGIVTRMRGGVALPRLQPALTRAGYAAVLAFLSAMALGTVAIGVSRDVTVFRDSAPLLATAEELWGNPIDPIDGAQCFALHGFGIDTYGHATHFSYGNLFEDYGWPARAVRTLVVHGLPRPSLRQIAADLPKQVSNIRILPLGFAIDTAFFAVLVTAAPLGLRKARGAWRAAHGQCESCAFTLGSTGSHRCPECGAVARVRNTGQSALR